MSDDSIPLKLDRLKRAIKRFGISRTELSSRIGYGRTHLHQIFNFKSVPSIDLLERILEALRAALSDDKNTLDFIFSVTSEELLQEIRDNLHRH